MKKYCSSCGSEVEEKSKYCTSCGIMCADKKSFTYNNKTFKEPSLYNYKGHSAEKINENYSKLIKNIDASFAIGVGVIVAFVALLIWISL